MFIGTVVLCDNTVNFVSDGNQAVSVTVSDNTDGVSESYETSFDCFVLALFVALERDALEKGLPRDYLDRANRAQPLNKSLRFIP